MNGWLAKGKELAGISYDELWFRYRSKAGSGGVGIDAFRGYFNGKSLPLTHDFQLIGLALNELLEDSEHEFRVPVLMRFVAPTGYGTSHSSPRPRHLTWVQPRTAAA